MAGFTAEGVVEALDWDFKPYVNAHGTIPEPTDKQIGEFMRGIKKVFADARKDLPDDLDLDDPVALLKVLDDLDPAAQITAMTAMCGVYSELCSGSPSTEQIAKLPMRVRSIFFNWLQSEVMAPEAAPGAGQAQVTPLRTGRAG